MRCAAALFLLAMAASTPATASDYGCKVLLCLSDPRGPTTEAECRPPIRKLYRELARGKPFPSCAMGGAPGTYAKLVRDPYDPCPDGTRAVTGLVSEIARPGAYRLSTDQRHRESEGFEGYRPRACAGAALHTYDVTEGDGDSKRITVYESLVWQHPQNPRAIDVYIDNQLHQRVRW